MPTYEYRCKNCKKHFEQFQKISDPPLDKCPDCGGKVTRLISAAAFTLKGGGWYKDGYSSSTTSGGEKKSPKVTKKDDKKAKTTE
jgi:putative FmdB family regulatory protein